jgi:hypothetical protein
LTQSHLTKKTEETPLLELIMKLLATGCKNSNEQPSKQSPKMKMTTVIPVNVMTPDKTVRRNQMGALPHRCAIALVAALLIVLLPFQALAEEDAQSAMQADKTGTNPINFTFDARIYNEYQWLNTEGDGHQNITTLEFRAPLLDGKLQFRVKARYLDFSADLNDDGTDDLDDSGFGDTDIRFLTVPYLDMAKKRAVAVGLEMFLDTASEDSLGSGATSLGPQVFTVFFKPFGGLLDLASPAYQHKFSIDEDDGRSKIHQGLIDVFFLKMSKDKQRWTLVNPTLVLDYENNTEFLLVDAEVGSMLDKVFGTKGHSVYLRPGIQIGADRPAEGSVEFGYKIIW